MNSRNNAVSHPSSRASVIEIATDNTTSPSTTEMSLIRARFTRKAREHQVAVRLAYPPNDGFGQSNRCDECRKMAGSACSQAGRPGGWRDRCVTTRCGLFGNDRPGAVIPITQGDPTCSRKIASKTRLGVDLQSLPQSRVGVALQLNARPVKSEEQLRP